LRDHADLLGAGQAGAVLVLGVLPDQPLDVRGVVTVFSSATTTTGTRGRSASIAASVRRCPNRTRICPSGSAE